MFSIRPCSDRVLWTAFLDEQKPHTFLQSWEWKESSEALGYTALPLGIFAEDKLVGTALTIVMNARRGRFILVPHGPILCASLNVNRESLKKIWELLVVELKHLAQEHHAVFIRVCPLIEDTSGNADFLHQLHFRPAPIHQHLELTCLLDLKPTEEELLKNMRKTTRQSIRKAEESNMRVDFVTDISGLDDFWNVYQTTIARQQFTPFSRAYLEAECRVFAQQGRLLIALGRIHDTLVSAAIITMAHGSAAYHHGASDQSPFPKVPAAHLLQWRIIQEVKRRGCHAYNFWGVVPESATNHPWYGLSVFKRGFGGFEEAYIHAHDMPVSPRYWLTWAIESLRKRWRRL